MEGALKYILVFLVGVLVALAFSAWMACGFLITTNAMSPKLKAGDMVFINRTSKGVPKRGTLMLIRVPNGEAQLIRRLIAFPGEEVKIENGTVLVNGESLSEPYLVPEFVVRGEQFAPPVYFDPIIIEEGRLFFLADDRTVNLDSREFGNVGKEDIMGKVWTVFGQPLVL